MFSSSTLGALLGTLLLITSIPDATSFTKYGRTCKDIGCPRDEVCVMAEDPCSNAEGGNCGRYPTCAKAHPGQESCATKVCGGYEYCKTENGVPTCVRKSTAIGYESAGVSSVNGQRVGGDENRDRPGGSISNSNPYANANAPPPPADPVGGYHQVNSGTNLGYPAYPSNTGSSNGNNNNGYPPYPSTNHGNQGRHHDLGYPPYPTNNRMPVPGYPGQLNPGYPGQYNPGYPAQPGHYPAGQYPAGQYPGYQNYPYANHPNQNKMYTENRNAVYRRNDGSALTSSLAVLCFSSLVLLVASRT